MKKILLFFILGGASSLGCASPGEVKGAVVNPPGVWFKTDGAPHAVALLAPGLNFKAEKMNSLAETLQKNNIEVYRMSLTGLNGNDMDALINATSEIWRNDFKAAFEVASQRSTTLNVPLYFIGFSLGALVGLNEMTQDNSLVRFSRMALFAPALSLRTMTKLLHALQIFGKGFCLPSKNLPEYRVYSCTPMGAYGALLSSISEFQNKKTSNENVPTLVFIDPQDELVSLDGLKQMVQDRGLTQWSFFEIDESETLLSKRIHHLIIDEKGVGPRQWKKITEILRTHFGADSAPVH